MLQVDFTSMCFAIFLGVFLNYSESYVTSDDESPGYYENITNVNDAEKQILVADLSKSAESLYQQSTKKWKNTKKKRKREKASNLLSKNKVLDLLKLIKLEISAELQGYNFRESDVHELKNLIMRTGGQPRRTLILSTWRSGSTFLGEIINSVPGNYYHDEPLHKFGIIQIRGPPFADTALNVMKKIFFCKYDGLESFLLHAKLNTFLVKRNKRLWEKCGQYNKKHDLCFNGTIVSRFCRLFPFQSMKVLRLRLQLVEELLQDAILNVRVVLLVRDPRAVMHSRQKCGHFCKTADCSQHERLCADMLSDFKAATRLVYKFPKRIMFLRFEDLILYPEQMIEKLFKFIKIGVFPSVNEYLRNHTSVFKGGAHSTYRVSKFVPLKWKKNLDFEYVYDIQKACKEPMRLWNYRMVNNESDMKSFSNKDYHKYWYRDIASNTQAV